jgi:hypothetical protein
LVALSRTPEAFEEDCRQVAVVVSPRMVPPWCSALMIDRAISWAKGAVALRRGGDRWEVKVARPADHGRPWARLTVSSDSEETLPSTNIRPAARDATPQSEMLEPGD